jgi:hypothetical protein
MIFQMIIIRHPHLPHQNFQNGCTFADSQRQIMVSYTNTSILQRNLQKKNYTVCQNYYVFCHPLRHSRIVSIFMVSTAFLFSYFCFFNESVAVLSVDVQFSATRCRFGTRIFPLPLIKFRITFRLFIVRTFERYIYIYENYWSVAIDYPIVLLK